jgi:hypothetical protein
MTGVELEDLRGSRISCEFISKPHRTSSIVFTPGNQPRRNNTFKPRLPLFADVNR